MVKIRYLESVTALDCSKKVLQKQMEKKIAKEEPNLDSAQQVQKFLADSSKKAQMVKRMVLDGLSQKQMRYAKEENKENDEYENQRDEDRRNYIFKLFQEWDLREWSSKKYSNTAVKNIGDIRKAYEAGQKLESVDPELLVQQGQKKYYFSNQENKSKYMAFLKYIFPEDKDNKSEACSKHKAQEFADSILLEEKSTPQQKLEKIQQHGRLDVKEGNSDEKSRSQIFKLFKEWDFEEWVFKYEKEKISREDIRNDKTKRSHWEERKKTEHDKKNHNLAVQYHKENYCFTSEKVKSDYLSFLKTIFPKYENNAAQPLSHEEMLRYADLIHKESRWHPEVKLEFIQQYNLPINEITDSCIDDLCAAEIDFMLLRKENVTLNCEQAAEASSIPLPWEIKTIFYKDPSKPGKFKSFNLRADREIDEQVTQNLKWHEAGVPLLAPGRYSFYTLNWFLKHCNELIRIRQSENAPQDEKEKALEQINQIEKALECKIEEIEIEQWFDQDLCEPIKVKYSDGRVDQCHRWPSDLVTNIGSNFLRMCIKSASIKGIVSKLPNAKIGSFTKDNAEERNVYADKTINFAADQRRSFGNNLAQKFGWILENSYFKKSKRALDKMAPGVAIAMRLEQDTQYLKSTFHREDFQAAMARQLEEGFDETSQKKDAFFLGHIAGASLDPDKLKNYQVTKIDEVAIKVVDRIEGDKAVFVIGDQNLLEDAHNWENCAYARRNCIPICDDEINNIIEYIKEEGDVKNEAFKQQRKSFVNTVIDGIFKGIVEKIRNNVDQKGKDIKIKAVMLTGCVELEQMFDLEKKHEKDKNNSTADEATASEAHSDEMSYELCEYFKQNPFVKEIQKALSEKITAWKNDSANGVNGTNISAEIYPVFALTEMVKEEVQRMWPAIEFRPQINGKEKDYSVGVSRVDSPAPQGVKEQQSQNSSNSAVTTISDVKQDAAIDQLSHNFASVKITSSQPASIVSAAGGVIVAAAMTKSKSESSLGVGGRGSTS